MRLSPTDPLLVVPSTTSAGDETIRASLCKGAKPKVWLTVPGVFSREECSELRQLLDETFLTNHTVPGKFAVAWHPRVYARTDACLRAERPDCSRPF